MSKQFFPRALVRFEALLNLSRTTDELQTISSVVRPRSVSVTRNDFNTADTAEIILDVQNFPILPRMVRQVFCTIYMGDADRIEDPFITDFAETVGDLVRFAGYVDDPEMSLDENDGTITWKLRDFTALLMADTRPPTEVTPSYADNLAVALRRIVNNIPQGKNIKLRYLNETEVVPESDLGSWPDLSIVAPKALAGAKIPVKPEDTAWDLIKRCCDPLSLVPSIYLDQLIVRTSRGLISDPRRPVFVYGSNLMNYKEKRQTGRSKEGTGLTGYLASTRKPIMAFYPPPGDPAISKSKQPFVPAKEGNPAYVEGTEDRRKWFIYGTISSQKALDDAAFRIFTERSRQEWEASFECRRMRVVDDKLPNDVPDDDATFDVMTLANADRIWLGVEPDLRQMLAGLSDTNARVQFLVDNGYGVDVAPVMVKAFEVNLGGVIEAYVRKIEFKIDDTGFSADFEVNNLVTIESNVETGEPVVPAP
jgi:hypothetical protein